MAEALDDKPSLLAALARGDSRAVAECLRDHGDLLWSLACRFAAASGDREEAAAEAFEAIWREAGRYRESQCSETLIVAMLARRRLSAWRRERGDRAEATASPEDVAEVGSPDHDDGRLAARVLQQLEADAQRVAVLGVGHGLTAAEIAQSRGLDEARVNQYLRQSLEAVRRAMDGDEPVAEANPTTARQRLLDVLADAVTRRLDDAEEAELAELLASDEAVDGEAMERAAAALVLAMARAEAMPASVRERIMDRWRRWPGVTAPRTEIERREGHGLTSDRVTRIAAYWLAAAGLVLAVVGWWPTLSKHVTHADGPRERLQALLAADTAAIEAEWQSGAAAPSKGPSGRVVWSQDRQEGYMILDDVPANDPDQAQYQLWIFDAERDDYPVNGGLFNVPTEEPSVVIPIDPEIRVGRPELFAITREKPGGVVVSDREEVVLKAQPEDGGGD
jgi:RNA polymerase sigma factor (sigma-70 family)